MEGLRRAARILVSLAVGLLMSRAASGQSIAHVQGSYVAVRSQPSVVAPIAGYLTTNTIVELAERGTEWCRIRSTSTASLTAFISCRALGDAPVTLDVVRAQLRIGVYPPEERLDWLGRRFWLAPSLQGLADVGEEMTSILLSEKDRNREDAESKPHRPRNPAFEAMKARLAAGVVPSSADHYPASVEDLRYFEPLQNVLKQRPLPPVQRSLFRRDEPLFVVALHPLTLTEQGGLAIPLSDALSAVHGVPLRTRTLKPAGYGHTGPIGTWDISSVGVQFDSPVTLNAVTARGESTGLSIASISAPIGDQLCVANVMSYNARSLDARWAAAIVGWVGKPAPARATVTTATFGESKYGRVTLQQVDLNGDKIDDFLLWSGVEAPERSPSGQIDLHWRAVFANVDGQWIVAAFGRSHDCT